MKQSYVKKKAGFRPELKEFLIGAGIVFAAFVILLVLGYFEGNMTYIGITLILITAALVVSYFIGYHHTDRKK